ncbi:DUF3179 domain-containing protein [soil metagenome]
MRWVMVVVVVVLLLAACSSGDPDEANGRSGAEPFAVDQVTESPEEDVPSALVDIDDSELPTPLVGSEELMAGGPPPDGIPPIDEARFLDADDVDFLQPSEPVLAIELDGEARAYPVQIMIWHEIVNDTIAGIPVSVTYCPLCNTAVAVDRRVGDRTLSFGTSGMLYQSALVMYDRQTESLWSHFTGQAVAGTLTDTVLDRYPVATVSWDDWLAAHPDGLVLSRETGEERDYGRNPYPGYDDIDNPPFLFDGPVDGRLAAKERIVGIGLDTTPTAIRLDPLLDAGVVTADLDGDPVVAWALPGTTSALEAGRVDEGRDVGATGVFHSTLDGRELTFERVDDGFVDNETATTWDVLGSAVEGPLAGEQLEPVEHLDTFWFAWGAFAPDTFVVPAVE